jgi:Zn-dependent protease
MRDLLSWSLPLGRISGIAVKVHILFPVVAIGLILRAGLQKGAPSAVWLETTFVVGLLFVCVLLHELGHCLAARLVDGEAHEILLWPLGGLALVDVPHTPRANFITAAGGPFVNLLLAAVAAGGLIACSYRPPLEPWWIPITYSSSTEHGPQVFSTLRELRGISTEEIPVGLWVGWLARFFWLNWVLLLLNTVLLGFPMDMGRMLQSAFWPRFGFRQATLYAVYLGFLTALVLCILSITALTDYPALILMLGLFIMYTCQQQWVILETGGEESLFGYDFSQGYTSLEPRERPRRRRPNMLQRWLQRRAARKLQNELEQREAEERRMDQLLEKVQRQGLQALSEEERRFLTRVSAKYRNRQ